MLGAGTVIVDHLAVPAEDDDALEAASARLRTLPFETYTLMAAGSEWTIAAVADHDALIRAADGLGRFPFGLVLWDSAILLADVLAEGVVELRDRRVLEVGAGVGLAGLAARRLGAAVTQTDHAPEALAVARENCARNGLAGIRYRLVDWHDWEGAPAPDLGSFDVVIGSDVLYARESHEALLALIRQALSPGGTLILTDPGRRDAPAFISALEALQWPVSRRQHELAALAPLGSGDTVQVDVIMVRRPPPAT